MKNELNLALYPGRRRGIPDERDNYAPHETQAKSIRRTKAEAEAAEKKILKAQGARVADICRSAPVKGICPICGKHVGQGVAGHVYAHVRRGDVPQWPPLEQSKIESTMTISTDQT